ncbi:MAG TPA: peptide MFS transporter [Candidatus Ozemobacteraceae bacterium]|nr:peptide MFS transporter [Candidatus Ozemobacteraceae bacterium]
MFGHPAGLFLLFTVEMWERFSYYGMRAIFTLFMIKALMLDKALASDIYGSYTGLVYLTPLLGGYLSDRYLGNRRSILMGGLMMAAGQFLLFGSAVLYQTPESAKWLFYAGLGILILGNGFFKPNISTMVGQLYPAGDKRVDSAFTIFYMGINLGAFFSPLICGGLGDTGNPADFKYGFLAAGIGMVVGVLVMLFFQNKYLVTPEGEAIGMPKPKKTAEEKAADGAGFTTGQMVFWGVVLVGLFIVLNFVLKTGVVGALIYAAMIVVPGMILSDTTLTPVEKQRIWVIFILVFFVIFFWSAFEQAGASLTYFAEEQTDRTIMGWTMPASYFQSLNPVAIILFANLFTMLWLALGRRNMEPSSPLKMAIGLLLLSISYFLIAFGVKGVDANTKISMYWLVSLYLIQTFGELCLSPIGLSMVSKLAPVKFASLLMGTWFLSSAAANKFAGMLSGLYPPGIGEFKMAAEKGIMNLPDILAGKAVATAEQLKTLAEIGVPAVYPSLLGYPITNLYEFFMIFAISSGASAVILFFLYRKLSQMMHGVN